MWKKKNSSEEEKLEEKQEIHNDYLPSGTVVHRVPQNGKIRARKKCNVYMWLGRAATLSHPWGHLLDHLLGVLRVLTESYSSSSCHPDCWLSRMTCRKARTSLLQVSGRPFFFRVATLVSGTTTESYGHCVILLIPIQWFVQWCLSPCSDVLRNTK